MKSSRQRAASDRAAGTKQDRVRDYVLEHAPQIFRIADVRVALPGVSDPTIRLTLEQLKNEGKVMPEGRGRSAAWVKAPASQWTMTPVTPLRNEPEAEEHIRNKPGPTEPRQTNQTHRSRAQNAAARAQHHRSDLWSPVRDEEAAGSNPVTPTSATGR